MRGSVASAQNLDIFQAAIPALKQIWRPPFITYTECGGYQRAVVSCPLCGGRLATYKCGESWTENGLAQPELHNCSCGQKIDYRGIPNAQH